MQKDSTAHAGYNLWKVLVKDYDIMKDGKSFFDKPVKSYIKTYDNIREITIG